MQRAETDKCLTHSEYWAGLYRVHVNYGDHMGQDKDGKQVRARRWATLYNLERPAKPSSHVLYFQSDPYGSLLFDTLLHLTHGFHQGQQPAYLIHCDNSNTQSTLKQEPSDD